MAQIREQILQHLQDLLGTLPGVALCARDRGELSNDQRPGLIILDGAETIIGDPAVNLKRVSMPPTLFTFRPQIIFVAKERDTPTNLTVNGQAGPIGPELTYWLDLICDTILSDQTLIQLVTTNGNITYMGHDTDMTWGSSMIGAVQIHLQFIYPWYPPSIPSR